MKSAWYSDCSGEVLVTAQYPTNEESSLCCACYLTVFKAQSVKQGSACCEIRLLVRSSEVPNK